MSGTTNTQGPYKGENGTVIVQSIKRGTINTYILAEGREIKWDYASLWAAA